MVEKYDAEFPDIYLQEFLEYLDNTEDKFWNGIDSYRRSHIWKKVDKK